MVTVLNSIFHTQLPVVRGGGLQAGFSIFLQKELQRHTLDTEIPRNGVLSQGGCTHCWVEPKSRTPGCGAKQNWVLVPASHSHLGTPLGLPLLFCNSDDNNSSLVCELLGFPEAMFPERLHEAQMRRRLRRNCVSLRVGRSINICRRSQREL